MNKILILILISSSLILCQETKEFPKSKIFFNPEKYVCYQTNSKIIIDGKDDEEDWQKAEWTKSFVDIEGELKPKPYHNTKVKMLWDENYFYFFAKLEEPHIWAKLIKRDTVIFYDNDFEVFIDPDGDTHKYYEFEINAFNTQWDLLITKPYRDDARVALNGWDIDGLKTAIDIKGTINNPKDTDEYWTVEIAYPFKALSELDEMNYPPKDGDQWRVNFSRVQWETEVVDGKYEKKINKETGKHYPENNWVWSPQGLIAMHAPETWGFVQFSDKLVGSETVEFNFSEDEFAKWFLRKVYYAEYDYKFKHHVFTDNYDLLNVKKENNIVGYCSTPEIKITNTQFEITLKKIDGKSAFVIYQDGLIRKIKLEE